MPEINGVTIFEIPHKKTDERGDFTKILSLNVTPELYIVEVFFSKTKKGFEWMSSTCSVDFSKQIKQIKSIHPW